MSNNKNFDITPLMAPYFDVHMVSPLLDFLLEIKLYDPKKITVEKIRAVERTNMIELVEEEYERYPQDAELQSEYNARKTALADRKNQIFAIIDNEPEVVRKVATFFKNGELINSLRESNTLTVDYLQQHQGITLDALEAYYKFSKFKYECGMYIEAEDMLGNYLSVITPVLLPTTSYQSAVWGRLACRILQAKWTDSLLDLKAVKESIDIRHHLPMDQLKQRAWLMHWALFVYLNQRDGVDTLVDLYSERYYLQTLENLCPWLLRYYTVAMILSPSRRRTSLKDILSIIQSLKYLYSDSVTQFLDSLFDAFDFDIAQVKLIECGQLVKQDFFLQIHYDKFMHEARMLICEMYCTVHRTVDLKMLATKLQLNDEEAEKWMVDMVRGTSIGHASLDAKIDSFGKQVIISPPVRQTQKQIVEVTKELTTRSTVLTNNLEVLAKDPAFRILTNHRS